MASVVLSTSAYGAFTAGGAGTLSNALTGMPAIFGSMSTLAMQVGVGYTTTGVADDSLGLTIRIMAADATTVLAANDAGGTAATLVTEAILPASGTTLSVTFGYVNPSASQATWDNATVDIAQSYTQSMQNDGSGVTSINAISFDAVYFDAITGSLSTQETGLDSASFTGSILIEGSVATQEVGTDSFSGSASLIVTGNFGVQETLGSDTFAGTADAIVTVTMEIQEPAGSDSLNASGNIFVIGDLFVSESGSDISVSTGRTTYTVYYNLPVGVDTLYINMPVGALGYYINV